MNKLVSKKFAVAASTVLIATAAAFFVGTRTGSALANNANANAAAAVNFKIDPAHAFVMFKVGHLGVGTAWGMIKDPKGTLTLAPDALTINLELDIAKMDSANAKRDEHLQGPDFFNAAQFPKATFKSTSSKPLENGNFEVTGDFTIRDVTKSVTVTLNKVGEKDLGQRFGYRAGFDTQFNINRFDYGVSYMPDGLGKDVTIFVSIEAIRE